MNPASRHKMKYSLLLALLFTPLSGAWADLLPSRFVLQRSRALLASPWRVEITLSGEDLARDRPLSSRWRVHPAGRELKIELESGGAPITPKPLLLMIWTRLFLEGDPSLLARDLRVNMERAQLGLLGDHVCHVIGHPKGPQIYFDQDTFTPLRVRVPSADGGLEVEMTRWEGPPTQGRFPRRIRVREGRRWVMELGVDSYQEGLPTAPASAPTTSRP